MSECPTCAKAELLGQSFGGYQRTCPGCTARGLARSQAAFFAFRNGRPLDLRDAIQRAFKRTPYDEAMAMVRRWWDLENKGAAR